MFFEEGEKVQCNIGDMVGEFIDFGFDMMTRTSIVKVKVGDRVLKWPANHVTSVEEG